MSFLDTVRRARAYLEEQGRVSLRALQREFGLDGDALDELVDELVDVQQVAAREGEVLSWIVGAPQEPSGPHAEPRAPRQASSERAEIADTPEAERRQLTVLFCDLVDSTKIAAGLDPEDWREVVRAYQQAAVRAVELFGGHVAQYLGDGLLVYFGWPKAHEDDAERAVRAGLGIVQAVDALREKGHALAVRVGVHTGPVVVGEMGGGAARQTLAVGDTANVAARLQTLADPGAVVLSSATLRLVSGIFITRDLGAREVKGLAAPLRVHRALRPSGVRSRLDVMAAADLTPFVGRDQELGLLENRFVQASEGSGHAVLISGEAGIGKSRLVQAFRERLAERTHTWLECQGSPYASDSAFLPMLELQRRALGLRPGDPPEKNIARIAAEFSALDFDPVLTLPVAAALHGIPLGDPYTAPGLPPDRMRSKTLELLIEWLLRLGRRQPLVLLLEDLHWMDPSTLEVVGGLLEQAPTAPVLLLATHRPDFETPWRARGFLTQMLLSRFTRAQLGDLVRKAARGRDLPDAWLEEILRRAGGVPLFAEELTKAVLEAHPEPHRAGDPLPALQIPDTLQDLLMARLDALGPVKELAQVGSVLGSEFPYNLLLAVSAMNEPALLAALRSAVQEEILYLRGTPPEATYFFKHALIQDTAYGSLLRRRRVELHADVAAALENEVPEISKTEPELIAHHYTESGQVGPAIEKWHEAARGSLQRSASKEASLHLKRALELLAGEPPSPERDRMELGLQIDLSSATMTSHGWGSREGVQCYDRARELCRAVGDERDLFPVLWGFWIIHMSRSEVTEWREIAAELRSIAERQGDPALLVQAHHASWGNFFLGDFQSQLEHIERGLSYYDPAEHSRLAPLYGGHDAGVCGHTHRAVMLWAMGYPDQARQSIEEAYALAERIAHPLSKAHAAMMGSLLAAFGSDWAEALRAAGAADEQFSEVRMPTWSAMTSMLRGWALVGLGRGAAGVTELRRGLKFEGFTEGVGAATLRAIYAEALHREGSTGEAMATLQEALPMMQRTRQAFWTANAMALKGDLLVATGQDAEAEESYREAVDLARAQSARMWELRAATRLARLWRRQGKIDAARDLLAPARGWFTEGLGTADLQDATTLLEGLGGGADRR